MFFEAELKNKKYKIEVLETPQQWKVSLTQHGTDNRENFSISKRDFQEMDDAISFLFNQGSYTVDVVGSGIDYYVYTRGSFSIVSMYNDERLLHESLKQGSTLGGSHQITAGMPGKIVKILVKPGDKVHGGMPVLIMEAMKMENEIRATHEATVTDIKTEPGKSVEVGAVLIVFDR